MVERLAPKFERDDACELLAEVLMLSLMFGFNEWWLNFDEDKGLAPWKLDMVAWVDIVG